MLRQRRPGRPAHPGGSRPPGPPWLRRASPVAPGLRKTRRRAALHEWDDRRTQGGSAKAPAPDRVRAGTPWSSDRPAEDDAALVAVPPYHVAGRGEPADESLRGTPGGVPGRVRCGGVAGDRAPGADHARDARADDAARGSSPRCAAAKRGRRRCAAWRTAARGCRGLSSSGRCGSSLTTGFVNAYGLTETTSSIAVLSPEDHRAALASDDPAVRDRLGSGPGAARDRIPDPP